MHLPQNRAHVLGLADDVRGEIGGGGQFSAQLIAQQELIKALHRGQQRQFPFGILKQSQVLEIANSGGYLSVKPKGSLRAIAKLVTEVLAPRGVGRLRPSAAGIAEVRGQIAEVKSKLTGFTSEI